MEETQIYVYNTRTKPWCSSSTMTNRQRYFLQLCSIHGWIVKSALYTWKMRNEKPLTPRQTKWNGLRVWCVCFFVVFCRLVVSQKWDSFFTFVGNADGISSTVLALWMKSKYGKKWRRALKILSRIRFYQRRWFHIILCECVRCANSKLWCVSFNVFSLLLFT